MSMTDDAPRIAEALRKIDGITVTTAWPKEKPNKTVVLVTLAGDRPVDWRDNKEYLTELEYYVRVFTAKADEMRRVCGMVHKNMEELGYEKSFRWEDEGQDMRQTTLRYKITI